MFRNEIHVINFDGSNPTNLKGRLHGDWGDTMVGYVTGLGAISFDIPDDHKGNGADLYTNSDECIETYTRVVTNTYDGGLLTPDVPVKLNRKGVNPFDIPDEELRNFFGSIWTARSPIPFGPRPLDPSNILAMDEYPCYDAPTRRRMILDYKARGYKQAPLGPFGPANYGYHDNYGFNPDLRGNVPFYRQVLTEFWDAGLYPVLFGLNQGDGFPDTASIEATYGNEYRQIADLVRLFVPYGWEPGGYNISNAQWVERFDWARRTFPHSILCLHMIADFDGPIGGDDGIPPMNMTKEDAWRNLYNSGLRVFIDQVAGYTGGGSEVPTQAFLDGLSERINWFKTHFAAWGLDIDYDCGEFAAYADYHFNWDEKYAQQIGRFAMDHGARGVFDGGLR